MRAYLDFLRVRHRAPGTRAGIAAALVGLVLALAACAHVARPGPAAAPPQPPAPPQLVIQQGTSSLITELAVDPQNRLLASVTPDGIRLWDLRMNRILRMLPAQHPGSVDGGEVAFSPDGALLVNQSPLGGWIRVFDVRTGNQVPAPALPEPAAAPPARCGRRNFDCVVAFAPDGRSAVTATQSSAAIRRWQRDARALTMPSERIELRLLPSGRLVASWLASISSFCSTRTTGQSFCKNDLGYSRDGRHVAIKTGERRIALVNLDRLRVRALTYPARDPNGALAAPGEYASSIQSFVFSPDGRMLVVGDDVGDIDAVDVRSGNSRAVWDVRDNPRSTGLAASPNGQWLVSGVGNHSELWDLATGQPALNLQAACHPVFSPNSRRLACIEPERLTVWNVGSGAPIAGWSLRPLKERGHSLTLEYASASFSPDGATLFCRVNQQPHLGAWTYGFAYIMNVATKSVTHIGSNIDPNVATGIADRGRHLTWLGFDGTVRRYDFTTGRVAPIGRLAQDALSGRDVGPSGYLDGGLTADGRYAVVLPSTAVNSLDIGYVVFDTVAMKPLPWQHRGAWSLLGFSRDGRSALYAEADNSVALIDLASGRTTRRYVGHTDKVQEAAYTRDGGTLLTVGMDNTVRIWDAERQRQLGIIFPGAGGPYDWLVTAPNGSFDGSPGGWDAILWRFGGQTFDVAEPEAFFNDFFSPGLLVDLILRHELSGRTLASVDRRSPHVRIEVRGARPYGRTVRVRVAVSEAPADAAHARGSGARDLHLLRNGSLVRLWQDDALHGKSTATFEATVKLVAGTNDLQAYAFNSAGVRNAAAETSIFATNAVARRGTAYVVAFGVNRYANPAFSLRYAAKDAFAFAQQLSEQESNLPQFASVDVLSMTDGEATRNGILSALGRLARRVQPEDVVYIYFAGHGLAYRDRYYLIPYDLGYTGRKTSIDAQSFNLVLRHAVSDLDLASALLPVDAGRIVLVIDACQSGEALGDVKRIGPMNAKGLAQLAYDKGMYVLAASQGDQAALESSRYGHGLLTYALVEQALRERQAAAPESPNYVILRQWLAFAQSRVPELQRALMQSAQNAGRDLAFVPGEERTIPSADDRTLQRPRVFFPRYADNDEFVVATFPRPGYGRYSKPRALTSR